MTKQTNEWPAGRIIHLFGGCRAINGFEPMVYLDPAPIETESSALEVKSYGSAYPELEAFGLNIVGVDFYAHSLAIKELIPPEWRVCNHTKRTPWPCAQAIQKWSEIGHGAFQKKDGILWDQASRIAYQLRACTWRIREISESYKIQLNARVRQQDFKPGTRFVDGFTLPMYLALQAFLVDACILRDNLAEFAASFIFASRYPALPKLTTMAGLKKHLISKVESSSDQLLEQLKGYTDEKGWIHILGCYRDLVIHSTPLAQAEQKLFAVCDVVDLGDQGKLPIIICPIPENPSEIRAARAKGTLFEDFSIQFEAFIQVGITKLDGLQYVHQVLGDLSELALELAEYSPVPPTRMTFDKTNIIGPVVVKRG